MKKKVELEDCGFCGEPIGDLGTAICTTCGALKCVKDCIPGGNRTECVECEESADEED